MFNGSGTLSKLPPLTVKTADKPTWKITSKHVKSVATIPKMKAVTKMAEKLGKTVIGITTHADGGFTITTAEQHKEEKAGYWDKVLSDG